MEEPTNPSDLSPEQRDTAALVHRLLGKRIADRYIDFTRLAAGNLPLRVPRPLAGHALRELESILRQTLDVPMHDAAQPAKDEPDKPAEAEKALQAMGFSVEASQRAANQLRPRVSHKEEIENIATRLGLAADGDIARAWKSILQAQGEAHGARALHQIGEVDDTFRAEWQAPFDTVLRGLMIALQGKYAGFVRRIDQLVAMSNRSAAVTSLSKEIPGALPLLWHFFNKLETPDWLPHLAQRRLLSAPLAEMDSPDGRSLPLGQWPAGRYLLRMAKVANAEGRAKIAQALRHVTGSVHPEVQRTGTEIIAALPSDEAASLVDLAVGWLTPKSRFIMAQGPHDLIRKLAEGSQLEAALRVTRALFQVFPENGRLGTLFSQHMYEHFLPDAVRAIAPASGIKCIDLLAGLLDEALHITGKVSNEPPHDYSYYLSGTISEHGTKHDVIDALVGEITRAAKLLIGVNPAQTGDVVACLEKRGWKLFLRIALHVLSEAPARAPEVAQRVLSDPEFIDATWLRAEYGQLARSWFPSLPPNVQTDILAFIDSIPETYRDRLNARFEEYEKRPPTDAEQKERDASIIRDLVWHWRDVLPADRREAVEKEGDPDAWRRRLDEPNSSPLTGPDFSSRPIEEIVSFLKTWRPVGEEKRETATALAHQLREAAIADPVRYSTGAAAFVTLAPIYVRRLLEGLSLASNNKNEIHWGSVLSLIEAIGCPDDRPPPTGMEGDDPDWSWTRKAAMDVLASGLRRGLDGIPHPEAARVQDILLTLYRVAPRGPDSDNFEEGYRQFPHHGAQSTSRGAAVELGLLFLYWLSKVNEADIGKPPRGMIGKQPVIQQVLEAELSDVTSDGRIPRAILGRYISWLYFFDEEWLRKHLRALLPETDIQLRDAAWHAHLSADNGPVSALARDMQLCYETEIDRLNNSSDGRDQRHIDDRLAEYLIILYIAGALPDQIFEQFWNTGPARARQHAMWFLGVQLELPPKELPSKFRDRAISYWDRRLAAAKASSSPGVFREELGSIGQYFFRKGIPDAWLVEQLIATADAGFAPSDPYSVLDRLAKISTKLPDQAAQALASLIKCRHSDQWVYMTQAASMRTIFVNGLATKTAETASAVTEAINYLAAIGDTGYLDLLPG